MKTSHELLSLKVNRPSCNSS